MITLSIIIPTKNRYEYLKSAVKIIIDYKQNDLELIIHDNSTEKSEDFNDYITNLNDNRIKYIYYKDNISVVENCERAVSEAVGKYVCMIGDDDAIIPELCVQISNYALNNNIDGVVVNKGSYYWPDTTHAVWGDKLSGKLFLEKYTKEIKEVDVESELKKVLNQGAATSLMNMPRIYHGIVSNKKLFDLKAIAGTYFPGPSPDMANAIALCAVSNKVIYYDAPAIISGHGKKSTGGMGGEKKHHGSIAEQSHLPAETDKLWSSLVPNFWSGPTIYCESAEKALNATKLERKYEIKYAYMYAYCIIFERKYTKITINKIINNYKTIPSVLIYIVLITLLRGLNFLKNVIGIKFKKKKSVVIANTYDAYRYIHNSIGE